MSKKFERNEDLAVLKCWACDEGRDGRNRCTKCSGTGSVFWVAGRAFPYTERGEKQANTAANVVE